MGWSRLPEPGKMVRKREIGPCKDENCGHKDCEKTREMARSKCLICGEEIGYETRFYNSIIEQKGKEDIEGLVHAVCEEE